VRLQISYGTKPTENLFGSFHWLHFHWSTTVRCSCWGNTRIYLTLHTIVVMEGLFTTTGTPPELAVTSFAKGRDCNTDRRVGICRHRLVLSCFHVFVTVNNCYSNRSKASVKLLCILILLLPPCNWPGQNVRYVHHSAYSCHCLSSLQSFSVL